jgi:hypothetical protein
MENDVALKMAAGFSEDRIKEYVKNLVWAMSQEAHDGLCWLAQGE